MKTPHSRKKKPKDVATGEEAKEVVWNCSLDFLSSLLKLLFATLSAQYVSDEHSRKPFTKKIHSPSHTNLFLLIP